uniref:Uncharacterized protein n=1 Tax=Plectus sambesii TaxID=2011161 RepID=A0A914W0E9_9BILA
MTTTTKSCANQCVTIAVKANTEAFSGPSDLKKSIQVNGINVPLTSATLQSIKYGSFAFRGCLEDVALILGLMAEKELPKEMSSDKLHQAGTCSTVGGAVFSTTFNASLCSCEGEKCNNADVSINIGSAVPHEAIVPSKFIAACPPPSQSFLEENTTFTTCSSNSNCATPQLCCPVDKLRSMCKDPLYTKSVTGAICSEMRFTNNGTGQIFTEMVQSTEDMKAIFPQLSNDCNQPQTTTSKYLKKCDTYSTIISATADFRNIATGSEALSNLLSPLNALGMGPKNIADVGKISFMTRGCAEKYFSEAMSDGFPMIGDGVENLSGKLTFFNVPLTIDAQACNKEGAGGCSNSVQSLKAIAPDECFAGFSGSSCGKLDMFAMMAQMFQNNSTNGNGNTDQINGSKGSLSSPPPPSSSTARPSSPSTTPPPGVSKTLPPPATNNNDTANSINNNNNNANVIRASKPTSKQQKKTGNAISAAVVIVALCTALTQI